PRGNCARCQTCRWCAWWRSTYRYCCCPKNRSSSSPTGRSDRRLRRARRSRGWREEGRGRAPRFELFSSRASLDHRERDVVQVDVLASEYAARIGLGDEAPSRVVEEHTVIARIGLADALAERVDLVGRDSQSPRALHHAPARVVGILVDAVVRGRAVGVEGKVAGRTGLGRDEPEPGAPRDVLVL